MRILIISLRLVGYVGLFVVTVTAAVICACINASTTGARG